MTITSKQITEAEAIAAMKVEDADFYPFRVINASGRMHVTTWLESVAERMHDINEWFTDAENAANDASIGESIIIEMGRTMTKSGNPETLRFDANHFDWMINE